MNHGVVGVTVSAALAVLSEIAVSVVASSVPFSRNYSLFVSLAAFAIAVGLAAVSHSKRDEKPRISEKLHSILPPSPSAKPKVLHGVRRGASDRNLLAGGVLVWTGYIVLGTGVVMQLGELADQAIRILVFAAGVIALTFGYMLRADVRTALIFAPEWIAVRDSHGRKLMRPHQANNFRTISWSRNIFAEKYALLVADQIDGSDYFDGKWKYVNYGSKRLIVLCNLTEFGIEPGDVDGALGYWRMHMRPGTGARRGGAGRAGAAHRVGR